MGNRHPSIAPYELLRCGEGELVLAVGNDRQFARALRGARRAGARRRRALRDQPGAGRAPRRAARRCSRRRSPPGRRPSGSSVLRAPPRPRRRRQRRRRRLRVRRADRPRPDRRDPPRGRRRRSASPATRSGSRRRRRAIGCPRRGYPDAGARPRRHQLQPDAAAPQRGRWVRDQVDEVRRRGDRGRRLRASRRGRSEYLPATRRLRALLRRERFDLVHAHYGLAGWCARLAGARAAGRHLPRHRRPPPPRRPALAPARLAGRPRRRRLAGAVRARGRAAGPARRSPARRSSPAAPT